MKYPVQLIRRDKSQKNKEKTNTCKGVKSQLNTFLCLNEHKCNLVTSSATYLYEGCLLLKYLKYGQKLQSKVNFNGIYITQT